MKLIKGKQHKHKHAAWCWLYPYLSWHYYPSSIRGKLSRTKALTSEDIFRYFK